jgi:hypothetical protein
MLTNRTSNKPETSSPHTTADCFLSHYRNNEVLLMLSKFFGVILNLFKYIISEYLSSEARSL